MCEMLMPLNIGESSSVLWSGMQPMLCPVLLPGFSKTARSCPGHGETIGHGKDLAARSVLGWCLADDVSKRPAERPEAAKADVQADASHAAVGLAQQEHGPLHAAS